MNNIIFFLLVIITIENLAVGGLYQLVVAFLSEQLFLLSLLTSPRPPALMPHITFFGLGHRHLALRYAEMLVPLQLTVAVIMKMLSLLLLWDHVIFPRFQF